MKNVNKEMDKFKITIIQPDIIWENPSGNFRKLEKLTERSGDTDLIVLPEMFSTGFTMQPEKLKEGMNGPSVSWMKDQAAHKDVAITGSLIIEEDNHVFNRCLWVFPDGKIEYYDKRHLFTMSGEKEHYSPGNRRLTVEYRGWRFYPLICYDLRFPVWSRNTDNFDVMLYLANWPAPRHQVWKTLLQARAIENQAYCIGVNRVGKDGNGLDYLGDSCLIDPRGNAYYSGDIEDVRTFEISYSELHDFRKKFPVLKDMDGFDFADPDLEFTN